jgi:hypothetical protein
VTWTAAWKLLQTVLAAALVSTLGFGVATVRNLEIATQNHSQFIENQRVFTKEWEEWRSYTDTTLSGLSFDSWIICNNQKLMLKKLNVEDDFTIPPCSRPTAPPFRERLIPMLQDEYEVPYGG